MSDFQRIYSLQGITGGKRSPVGLINASLKDFEIPVESWDQAAQDPSEWRSLINKGEARCDEKRICEIERKRIGGKARVNGPSPASSTLTCSTCKRQFRAKLA